ncbi:glycosyltransferase [Holdemanella biformis]|uniref:glycosyltransferase n=1 Tax=Holdemanella biformis TaxID=1735 RepID=UPI0022DFEDBC|nr:glycosyltransferase [Holdemanella biformis]
MDYSVLLTVYKSDNPDYFKLSLESMINQTKPSNDIVVVKDGPVPESIEKVIKDLQTVCPNIHPLQLETNMGLGLALNEGLKVCKNELVARMDSDDISDPTRCEKQVAMFESDPCLDIVGCPVKEFIGTPNHVVGKRDVPLNNDEIHRYNRRRDPFNHPTVMYKKSKVLKYGPYGDYRKNQDTDLWIKLLSNGCKAANHSEYLLMFRFDEGTYKKRKSWVNTKLLIEIRKNAWKNGYCSLFDFLFVACAQLGIYILPEQFQRFVYTKLLRN